jgi:NAD(P)-dependent dehydrogenase (short-subunit alcohol dehydrogenase family)
MGVQSLLNLSGRVALVTGGSRGLGLQIAEALLEMGAQVAITARKKDELDLAVKHLGKATSFVGDIGKRDAIAPLAEAVLKKFGKVDILVNNAGATWGAPAEQHPLEAWDKLVNVNLSGAFVLTQIIALKSMIPAKWGRIINVASIAGLMGQDPRFAPTAAYTATKHGLVGLTRQLAAEWRTRLNSRATTRSAFRSCSISRSRPKSSAKAARACRCRSSRSSPTASAPRTAA